jgi:hypothetical protein
MEVCYATTLHELGISSRHIDIAIIHYAPDREGSAVIRKDQVCCMVSLCCYRSHTDIML